MEERRVTTMVLKVDLHCEKCYKKVKKILCSFREIQDQVYDEEQNKVTIKVVSCHAERIKQKILCKGGASIMGIEIKVPKEPEKPKELEKPKKPVQLVPCLPGYLPPPPCYWIPACSSCCTECSEVRTSGPCSYGHGEPPPCYRYYDGYFGWPVYDSYGGCGRGYCDFENSHCTIV